MHARLDPLPVTGDQRRQDAALAAAIGVGALISAALGAVAGVYGHEQAPMGWAVAYAAALGVPLAFRRQWPSTVAVVVAAAFFGAGTLHIPELYAGNIAMFIAFYTVGAVLPDRRRAAWVRAGITVGMFVWLLTETFIQAAHPTGDTPSQAGAFSPFVAYSLMNILVNALYFGGAYYFGERAWASSRQRRDLALRTAELEQERERTAAQAVALERVRIARELHDVVAHHVSLMGVQAGAARAVMAKDPDAAAATLSEVEASARAAIDELHKLLVTLREDSAATAPVRDLGGLDALVSESARAGVPATLTVVGSPRAVPDTVAAALVRIVQEALTNVRRHAGAGARADVRLRYTPDGVEAEVSNTGRPVVRMGQGLGLVGMRERAAACGGTMEARPRADGGFLVRATVPAPAGAVTGEVDTGGVTGNADAGSGPGEVDTGSGPGDMDADAVTSDMDTDSGPDEVDADSGPGDVDAGSGPGDVDADAVTSEVDTGSGPAADGGAAAASNESTPGANSGPANATTAVAAVADTAVAVRVRSTPRVRGTLGMSEAGTREAAPDV